MESHLLTLMVVLPVAGALLQAFLDPKVGRWVALGASLGSALCGLIAIGTMRADTSELQLHETLPWIGSYEISYEMGIDGLAALPVLLVSIVFPLLVAAEWNRGTGIRGMFGLFLVLQSALLGAACAQDLFLLFFFWSLTAMPFYFLIGVWGGNGRESAAFRSVVVASLGNALIFGAMVLVYYAVEPHTFSIRELGAGKLAGKTFPFLGSDYEVSPVAFALFAAGMALRAPVWPFHGWFVQVAEEAPPSVFIALSAATVPVATAIFMKVAYTLFPETVAAAAPAIVVVGGVNLVFGGMCALGQRGLRLLLAYVCLSEVGLILMGIGSLSPTGVVGAVYQQLVLGLAAAGFGLFVGAVIERADGASGFLDAEGKPELGGVASRAPVMAVVSGIVLASLLGVPGLGGFVSHSLLVIGSYPVHPGAVLVAGGALLLAAYYLLMMYRHVFLGAPSKAAAAFTDLTLREKAYFLPLVAALVIVGVYPKPLLELVRPTALTLLSLVK